MKVLSFVRTLAGAGAVVWAFAFAAATSARAEGVARSWVGGVDDDWATAGNWSPAGVPAAGDDVTIGAGFEVTLSGATAELGRFTLTGAGARLTMKEPVRAAIADCVTVLRANTVSITEGAVVTHVANTQTAAEYTANPAAGWMIDGRVNIVCETFCLDADSMIDANELGYDSPKNTANSTIVGPGGLYPKYVGTYNASAGHGGYGAGRIYDANDKENQVDSLGSQPYDSPEAPVMPGSSGTTTAQKSTAKLCGGGVVRIVVSGMATVAGVIRADASGSSAANTGLGSGGSVWLTARVVRGSGLMTANGGFSSASGGYWASGAGGRVALVYDPEAQDESDASLGVPTLRLQAAAKWTYASAKSRPQADVGSVYMTDDRFLGETFDGTRGVLDGQIFCGTWSRWQPKLLTVTDSWVRFPEGPATNLALSGDVRVSGINGRLEIGGDEAFPYSYSVIWPVEASELAPRVRRMSAVRPRLACANLTLADGGQFMIYPGMTNGVDQPLGAEIVLTGDFTVGENAFARLPCHPTNGAVVKVTAENVTVASGAWLSSAGQGFMEYKLPGTSVTTGGIAPGYPVYVRGNAVAASHGGGGYRSKSTNTSPPYDSLEDPLMPGSPGNRSFDRNGGTAGGGVVLIAARKKVTVDGTIDARGQCMEGLSHGTGSGGSVNITCQTLSGTGTVDATGGWHNFNTADSRFPNAVGAGGRIAVHYDCAAQAASGDTVAITWKCNCQARAETAAACCRGTAGIGTVWFSDSQFLSSTFGAGTLMSGEFHFGTWLGWSPADVVADGQGVNVRLVSGGHDFVINGNLTIRNGAALAFGGGTNCFTRPNSYPPFSPAGKGAVVKVGGSVIMEAPGKTGWKNELSIFAGHGCTVQAEDVGGVLEIARQFKLGTNSWVYTSSDPYFGESVKVTVGGKVTIDPDAGFNATGLGYSGGIIPVAEWQKNGYGPGAISGRGRGGAYGGLGGWDVGSTTATFPPPGYGTSADGVPLWQIPTKPGSGASLEDTGIAGRGGGLIWIETQGAFILAGSLIADGVGGDSGWSSSGSGGAVHVRCRHWKPTETAVIRAKGGATGGCGGGGCIAIWRAKDHDLSPTNERTYVSAPAGGYANTKHVATDGTIYWGDLPRPGITVFVR